MFKLAGDPGLSTASLKGYMITPNISSTDKDITVTLTDVYVDLSRISVGVKVKFPDHMTGQHKIESYDLFAYQFEAGSSSMDNWILIPAGDHEYMGTTDLFSTQTDSFIPGSPSQFMRKKPSSLDFSISKIDGIVGNWSFSVPISIDQVLKSSYVFKTDSLQQSGAIQMSVDTVSFTPSLVDIMLISKDKAFQYNIWSQISQWSEGLKVFDDKGNELRPLLVDSRQHPKTHKTFIL